MMVKLILFLIASHPYSDSIETNRSEYLAQKAQSEIFAFHYLYTQCFQGMDPRMGQSLGWVETLLNPLFKVYDVNSHCELWIYDIIEATSIC